MEDKLSKVLSKITWIGILLLVIGIISFIYPENIGKISAFLMGIFLIIGGLLRMSFSFLSFSMGNMFMRYLYAIIMLAAGIYIVSNPDMGLEAITMVLAIYFIVDGITQIIYSFKLMPMGGGMYLFMSGIIGIILGGFIVAKWPESSIYFLGIFIGVRLIIDGLTLILTSKSIKKANEATIQQ